MLQRIDAFLNATTMYRLLLYYLGGLFIASVVFSAFGVLPYNPIFLVASAAFLAAVSWLSNVIIARLWKVPTNAESSVITALILVLIIAPDKPYASFPFLLWAALFAVVSKYVLTIRGKHIFNPAAFGVAAVAFLFHESPTWWVGGNVPLLPFVVIGGLLVVRKLQRADLVLTFFLSALASVLIPVMFSGRDVYSALTTTIMHTSLLFFAFVMITEPLTTPPRRMGRILYGAFVGFLFGPWVRIGSFFFTPEVALLTGNIFSYLISPKFKALMRLKEMKQIATDTYEFVFTGRLPAFRPGQYAEFTIAADSSDSRGNRRYFTIASSPTESVLLLGIKFYANASSFKRFLAECNTGSLALVGSIAGDFTLPRLPWQKNKKLVFIAGGIGVTPFRSMVAYLADRGEKRDIVLLYSNKSLQEIAYKDIFDDAQARNIGFRAVYTLTDKDVPSAWTGNRGFIDAAMIAREVPDYKTRLFFVSGPRSMVTTFQKVLHDMGVPRRRIKIDFFPGFA